MKTETQIKDILQKLKQNLKLCQEMIKDCPNTAPKNCFALKKQISLLEEIIK